MQAHKCIFLKHLNIFSTINLITELNIVEGQRIWEFGTQIHHHLLQVLGKWCSTTPIISADSYSLILITVLMIHKAIKIDLCNFTLLVRLCAYYISCRAQQTILHVDVLVRSKQAAESPRMS